MLSKTTRNNILDKFPEIKDVRLTDTCGLGHGTSNFDGTTHFAYDDKTFEIIQVSSGSNVICFKEESTIFAASGDLSELFWHEYAHVLSNPKVLNDLDHGLLFSEAVHKMNRPWLDSPFVQYQWFITPPTLETWENNGWNTNRFYRQGAGS